MNSWIQSVVTLLTGGILWEGIKFFLPEFQKWLKDYRDARVELYNNIDPILKAADELYGKLFSLSNEDFATFINVRQATATDIMQNRRYIYYLFAQFWGRLEHVRLNSQYSSIARTPKGKHLIRFIETFESRKYRILDRSIQRMIGESLIEQSSSSFKIMSLNQFIISLNDPQSTHNIWIKKLEDALIITNQTNVRQRFLVFGIIVAALIDYFDPKYKIVRRREIYTHKLNDRSKKLIGVNLFKHYLPFVKNVKQYV